MSHRRRNNESDLVNALFAEAAKEVEKLKEGESWQDKAVHLRSLLMPIQARLEEDPARRVSVRSPRQTGKSTGVMLIVIIRCLEKANSEWVVVGLTRPSIKRIYWSALKQLNKSFELGMEFQHQELTATFKNGSVISFVGAENIGEIEKLRGGRYNGVVVDECKSFAGHVFSNLVHDVIEPALMAKNGQLFVIGTPGDILSGPFYLATCETPVVYDLPDGSKRQSNCPYGETSKYPALWSLHQWKLADNTTRFYLEDGTSYTLWDKALEIKLLNGWTDDNPTWRREYLGFWVPDDRRRVYRFRPYIHDYVPCPDTKWGLPKEVEQTDWHTVIGVDFGTRDGTAIVVWAWHPHVEGLWELYSEVRALDKGSLVVDGKKVKLQDRLTVGDIAQWYQEIEEEYGPFDGWPADPAGLATMVIDTLASEHQVYLEPAEKKEKLDHIELFNNDLEAGKIRVRRGSILAEQLFDGRWDEGKLEKGKRVEDPQIPNDASDAGLYAFRWCNHRRAQARAEVTQPYSPKWWEKHEVDELKLAQERARARVLNADALDREYWNDTN